MRRPSLFVPVILLISTLAFAQHSGGGSSGGSASWGSSGGAGYSSGGSSSSSSGLSGGGGSRGGGGGSSASSGGGHASAAHAGSTSAHELATHTVRVQPARDGVNNATRPLRKPVEPTRPPSPRRRERHIFSFLSGHSAVAKPPCRGKNCPARCPAGEVTTEFGGCAVPPPNVANCYAYDPSAACALRYNTTCSGPSVGVLQSQEAELERLRVARVSACAQDPTSQSCRDLTRWELDAQARLDQLRHEAATCR
jgi:hypothetical protein